jgi:pyridoxal biosynthesis lyase PdxS
MTEQTKPELSVSQMIRTTGENTSTFMAQIADHVDSMEQTVLQLQKRVADLEEELAKSNGNN